jgi:hypothetical protein
MRSTAPRRYHRAILHGTSPMPGTSSPREAHYIEVDHLEVVIRAISRIEGGARTLSDRV